MSTPTTDAAQAAAAMTQLHNHVGGRWTVGEGPEFTSTSPHTPDRVVGAGRHAGSTEVDAAITSAAEVRGQWRRTTMHERAGHLRRAADIIERDADDWAPLIARESGKPIGEARAEVGRSAHILRFHAQQADAEIGSEFASPRAGERILVERRPLGVVAVISPFNFPIAIPAWKIAPALIHGNVVVWKPPTAVAGCAVLLMRAFVEAGLPAGVLSLVHGDGEVGRRLVSHPAVDGITFTGSTPVGLDVAAAGTGRGVPVQAEMGGKNATVVLPDADLDAAAAAVVSGSFRSAGQKCTATSRLVVHRAIADDFLGRLARAMREITVGDPESSTTFVGPVISGAAQSRVDAATARALDAGATLIHRVPVPDGLSGHYCAPTIVEVESAGSELWQDELFGPTLAVLRADDVDHALDLADCGPYALSVAIFGNDLSALLDSIDQVRAGMVHINSETAGADPHVPFGGNGLSGIGPREQGGAARDFFTTTTTVYLRGGSR